MEASLRPLVDCERGTYRVPRRAFVDRDVFERERRAIFDRCWLYLGHASELPSPTDFLTREIAGRPVIFSRDREGAFHALLNVCPHRGALVCRERRGSANAFQCFYHGWSFRIDGRLNGLPGQDAYPPGMKDDPAYSLPRAPRMDRFGDFFFISFASDGEDLPTYLAGAGDYLNLLAEQSSAGMAIIGGTQEYAIRGNWKLLAENSVDGYHAATTHSTYLQYLKNANGALAATKLEGTATDLGNGHGVIEYAAPWGRPVASWIPLWGEDGKREIAAIQGELEARLGAARAERIARRNRNMLIFPNLVINDVMAVTVRTFWPLAPDYMNVNAWAIAPAVESDWLRKYRLFNFTEFLGPGGFATPDDVEAIEKCQLGFGASREAQYNDISRGMHRDDRAQYDDELQMRCFWSEWDRRIQAVAA